MELNDEVVYKLENSFKVADDNTYKVITNVVPEIKINNEMNTIMIISNNESVIIDYLKESLFEMLCEFTYSPIWFIIDKLCKFGEYEKDKAVKEIEDWINFNLVFIESLSNGDFIRPTNYLYEFFQLSRKKYTPIPFNMISHDVSKMDIYFQCVIGKCKELTEIFKDNNISHSDLYKTRDIFNICENKKYRDSSKEIVSLFEQENDNKIDLSSPEEIEIEDSGFMCIDEKLIKVDKKNVSKITYIENTIKDGIRSNQKETIELQDYSGFFIARDTGFEFVLQFPDLIIPIKRKEKGYPQSIAIEMELTPKAYDHYVKNLKKYRNNIKYGTVVWFSGDKRVKNNLIEAYKEIGGTGFVNMYIFDYDIPKKHDFNLLRK